MVSSWGLQFSANNTQTISKRHADSTQSAYLTESGDTEFTWLGEMSTILKTLVDSDTTIRFRTKARAMIETSQFAVPRCIWSPTLSTNCPNGRESTPPGLSATQVHEWIITHPTFCFNTQLTIFVQVHSCNKMLQCTANKSNERLQCTTHNIWSGWLIQWNDSTA